MYNISAFNHRKPDAEGRFFSAGAGDDALVGFDDMLADRQP